MSIERNITADGSPRWFTGTDKILTWTIFQADDVTPEDVSLWEMSYMIKKNPKSLDEDALLEKSVSGGGLSVVGVYDPDPAVNTQKIRCVVSDEDIVDFKAGIEYYHELKRMDAGSEEVLQFGTLVFSQAVHKD